MVGGRVEELAVLGTGLSGRGGLSSFGSVSAGKPEGLISAGPISSSSGAVEGNGSLPLTISGRGDPSVITEAEETTGHWV